MSTIRIIPCLDVDEGQVVKGIQFKKLKTVGDPIELAQNYYQQGADELVFLDVGATPKSRNTMLYVVRNIAKKIFIPFTVGGGIRTIEDIRSILNSGADKVSICSAALKNPDLITEASNQFGSQCIVLSIDAIRDGDSWKATMQGGRQITERNAIEWAVYAESKGAGEILLNSIDRDGTNSGYDLELLSAINNAVSIPVIASGGGGKPTDLVNAVNVGKADAVLIASILHYGQYTISQLKEELKKEGVHIR